MVVELGRHVRGGHRSRLMFFQPTKDRANDTVILVERGAARDEADRVPRIDEVAELAIANTQLLASDSQMNMREQAAQNWAMPQRMPATPPATTQAAVTPSNAKSS